MQEINVYEQVFWLIAPKLLWFAIGFAVALPLMLLFRHRNNLKRIQIEKRNDMIFKLIVFALGEKYSLAYKGPKIKLDDYSYSNMVTKIRIKVSAERFDKASEYLPEYNKSLREIKDLLNMKPQLVAQLVVEEDKEEFLDYDRVSAEKAA